MLALSPRTGLCRPLRGPGEGHGAARPASSPSLLADSDEDEGLGEEEGGGRSSSWRGGSGSGSVPQNKLAPENGRAVRKWAEPTDWGSGGVGLTCLHGDAGRGPGGLQRPLSLQQRLDLKQETAENTWRRGRG